MTNAHVMKVLAAGLLAGLLIVDNAINAAPVLTEFSLPDSNSNPSGITLGPDGALWFTELGPYDSGTQKYGPAKIGRILPNGTVTEFTIPTPNAYPRAIALGPDGNLWFTESDGNKIGRITPSGAITEFPIPTAGSGPGGITAGPDGNLWFTEKTGNKIGRITPSGAITEFPIPTSGSNPQGIVAGPDGNLWFTESNSQKAARVTPQGVITEFQGGIVPSVSTSANNIAAGPDGALWFAAFCNQLNKVTTTGTWTQYGSQSNCFAPDDPHPLSITVGADGSLWVNKFAFYTTDTSITGYTTAGTANGIAPLALQTSVGTVTSGPDGALWFTETSIGKIGRYGPLPNNGALVSAVLPLSRSVQIGTPATVFATIINTGQSTASGCMIVPSISLPGSYLFQTTDPATNALTGRANAPVTIAPGGGQSFVLAFTPNAAFAPTDVNFGFKCASTGAAAQITGLNSVLLSASATPVPDIVVQAATVSHDGILRIPADANAAAFATATVNVGASATITVTADTGTTSLPLAITLCQTDPPSGQCLTAPAATVLTTIATNATPTFAIFAKASGPIDFLPAVNRVFVRFKDSSGDVRGSTSVAVTTAL